MKSQPHTSATSPVRHSLGNTHIIEFVEVLHHGLQLCVHVIPVTGRLTSRFLQSGAPLVLQSLSTVTSCTVSCFRTVSATLDTVFFFAHSQCVIIQMNARWCHLVSCSTPRTVLSTKREKSMLSRRESISMVACVEEDRVRQMTRDPQRFPTQSSLT